MCAHKKTDCKGTKKIPYMQIYMGNSFKNVDFATKIGDLELEFKFFCLPAEVLIIMDVQVVLLYVLV